MLPSFTDLIHVFTFKNLSQCYLVFRLNDLSFLEEPAHTEQCLFLADTRRLCNLCQSHRMFRSGQCLINVSCLKAYILCIEHDSHFLW